MTARNPYTGGDAIVWRQGYGAGRGDARPTPPPFVVSPTVGRVSESIMQQRAALSNRFPRLHDSIVVTDARRVLLAPDNLPELLAWSRRRLGASHPRSEGNSCVEHCYRLLGLWCSLDFVVGDISLAVGTVWLPHHVYPIILCSDLKARSVDAVRFEEVQRADDHLATAVTV